MIDGGREGPSRSVFAAPGGSSEDGVGTSGGGLENGWTAFVDLGGMENSARLNFIGPKIFASKFGQISVSFCLEFIGEYLHIYQPYF